MNIDKSKLDNSRGYMEGKADAVDKEVADLAVAYKKDVCKRYNSINPGEIDDKLAGTEFFVSRKYDGELAVLFWNGSECFAVNSRGKVRMGLPCMEEAAKCFKAAKLTTAVIPSELYVNEEKERSRVYSVLAALADKTLHPTLRLAAFDIVSLDNAPFKSATYGETHKKLKEICGNAEMVRPVRCETAASKEEVKSLFAKWVDEEGGEGLVVRSELPMVYKVKNRHTLDAGVFGFSEGTGDTKGQVRALLLALMAEDGSFQIIGRCGNGLSDEQKKGLYPKLLAMSIESTYIETDSNHVAFHMIRPELVIELYINDLLFETNSGGQISNPLLVLSDNAYRRTGTVPGVSVMLPVISRFREDKQVNPLDVRVAQINEINFNPYSEGTADGTTAGTETKTLAKSELLKREVYKKTQGAKLMVQKFLLWKTNKEETGSYPAYVLAYTNYSSDRADALQNDIRVSDSHEQILTLYAQFIDKNVKKGWEKC